MPTAKFRPGDPRDIQAAKWEIEYEDVFHFKNFYKVAWETLVEQGWIDSRGGGTNWEHFYLEKTFGNGNKEHRMWWRMMMIPNKSPYVRYLMKVDYLTLNMASAETMYQGQKFKTWKGDVIVRCEARVQLDYKNAWGKNRFTKLFDEFFRKRIYKDYYEAHKKRLWKLSYDFNDELKKYLKIKTPGKATKPFRSERGVPS